MDNLQHQRLLYDAENGVGVDTIIAGTWKTLASSCRELGLEWMQCVEALKAGGQVCGESAKVIFSIRFLCPLLPGSYIWQHSSQQRSMQAGSRDSVVFCRYMLPTKMFPSVCF